MSVFPFVDGNSTQADSQFLSGLLLRVGARFTRTCNRNQVEKVRLIAKKVGSFFIVHLVDGIILPSDHGLSSMVHRKKGNP